MSPLETLARLPRATVEFANLILTTPDATIGATPRDVVWTHRQTTLYRYRSTRRAHAIPVLLVFALINRPEIFDLRPGQLVRRVPARSRATTCTWSTGACPMRRTPTWAWRRSSATSCTGRSGRRCASAGQDELSLVGWCIGGTLCAMYCALHPDSAVRNAVLLTTPIDPSGSLYARWVGSDDFDVDLIADAYESIPGLGIDWANKLMKPVTNYVTTYRRLLAGRARRQGPAASRTSRWPSGSADNPPFPGRAYREWITWMYKENRLVSRSAVAARPAGRPPTRSSRTCWS